MKCENYRGIRLLSIPSKVYARILDERTRSVTESKVLEAQGGFRKGRSCTDQLFTIRQLSEKMIEKNKKMVLACVDLEKVYDRVGREKLWNVLKEYGVKGRLLRAIRSLYKKSEACVRVKGELSGWFPITQGVRQGCVMSPWLFNVFMDKIVREGMENFVEIVQWSALSQTVRQLPLQLRTKNLANNSGAIKLLSSRHSCRSAIATAQLKDHHQRRAVKGTTSKKRCNREACLWLALC